MSSLIGTTAILLTVLVSLRTNRNLAKNTKLTEDNNRIGRSIHTEVKSINGQSGTELLEATEGRRIEADIPEADRTVGQQAYVDRLDSETASTVEVAPESPAS